MNMILTIEIACVYCRRSHMICDDSEYDEIK